MPQALGAESYPPGGGSKAVALRRSPRIALRIIEMNTTHMQRALALAAQALCLSNPNPRVGCVITSAEGEVLSEGFTQQAGGPHAEVMALRQAAARGIDLQGATAYVTLEPCSHYGRTGPCCDALVQVGIRRVVASLADPNPLVAGRGFERLRAAGVQVEVGPGAAVSRELNIGFFSRMQRGLPWVRMKVATSLDGFTALPNGASQWITSPEARADGHAWRARACAVLTGIGTILADDPRLDVREVETPRQPHLAIVDSRLRTPPGARLFEVPDRQILIYTGSDDVSKAAALQDCGAQIIATPMAGDGHVDLRWVLEDLARQRSVNELHVEAGACLNGALVRSQQVDELLLYMAPTLLGTGRGLAQWGPLNSLAEAHSMAWHAVDRVGADLRIIARDTRRDIF